MKTFAVVGAVLAAVAVAAGAFGAHALRDTVSGADLEVWRTAAHYLLVHGVAILVLGIACNDTLRWPCRLITLGSIVFSGSLFSLVLTDIRQFGAVAPVGGALLIAGWLMAAIAMGRGTIRQ